LKKVKWSNGLYNQIIDYLGSTSEAVTVAKVNGILKYCPVTFSPESEKQVYLTIRKPA
jgi:hypothetical protein